MSDPALWHRLERTQLGTVLGFDLASAVEAGEGWSWRRSVVAVEEYKRFLYLALVAGREIVPPFDIDTVWRRHVLHRAAYDRFCRDVFGSSLRPPDLSERERAEMYVAGYPALSELYRREFGKRPGRRIRLWLDSPEDRRHAPERGGRHTAWAVIGFACLGAFFVPSLSSEPEVVLLAMIVLFALAVLVLSRKARRWTVRRLAEAIWDSAWGGGGGGGE
jgi:hypothetical protein